MPSSDRSSSAHDVRAAARSWATITLMVGYSGLASWKSMARLTPSLRISSTMAWAICSVSVPSGLPG